MERQTQSAVQRPELPSNAGEIAQLVGGRRVVVASNRGPVEFQPDAAGRMHARRGAGGVVTALASLAGLLPLTWIAVAMTAGDRRAFPTPEAAAREVRLGRQRVRVRYVTVASEVYARYYDHVSNELLWFLQHYLWDPARTPNLTERDYFAWDAGYRPVNEAIAAAVADEICRPPASHAGRASGTERNAIVLLQDYHLYLAPALVRRQLPRATIQQFIHIPWPSISYWELLPERFLREIVTSLASCDVLGFQTPLDARNFLGCVRELFPDARIDFAAGRLIRGRHQTLARAYPITIDPAEVERVLRSAPAREAERELGPLLGEDARLIVRVDRLEPTKNVLRGLLAYEALLHDQPDLRGHVRHLVFLVPSRQSLDVYRRYERDVRRAVAHINAAYGTSHWRPVTAFFENNRARALVAMSQADVLLVNPIIDGMNLVVKEAAVANRRDGVIVLSRTAGAFQQLGPGVLPLTPTDIAETTMRLREALAMAPDERHRLATCAREIVLGESLQGWMLAQIRDAAQVRAGKRPRGREAVQLALTP